jgi:hypothetical protein
MSLQNIAPPTVEPGEDEDLVPDLDPMQRLDQIRLEDEPGIGRSLVALLGRRCPVGKWGFDPPHWLDLDPRHAWTIASC